jgi:uncharacterized membrane protein
MTKARPSALREHFAAKGLGSTKGFHWRGREITRFEGLSDAVFAFAVTLLIVSLEVPKTFTDLLVTMRGFAAFAICFALLMSVWYQQYIFFRRYGLQDVFTIVVNSALLFVVLFYIYPLKFLFSLLVNLWLGVAPQIRAPDGSIRQVIEWQQFPMLMIVFSLGYVAIFLIFALLFYHADRKHEGLALTSLERYDTRTSISQSLINLGVGIASILIAFLGGARHAGLSGLIYPITLAPLLTVHGMLRGRRRHFLEKES